MKCDLNAEDPMLITVFKTPDAKLGASIEAPGQESEFYFVNIVQMKKHMISSNFRNHLAEISGVDAHSIVKIKMASILMTNYAVLQLFNADDKEVGVVFNLDMGFVGCKK